MIEQLINNYGNFHDAIVLNVEHKTNIDLTNNKFKTGIQEVILVISCFNQFKDYEKNIIKIKFTEVEEFRYIKYDGMIIDSFKERENDSFIIDFDPIITSNKAGDLITKQNSESMLSIKFKDIFYEIIDRNASS
ncbi:MAG: hypothetical protein M0D53_08920 [Flavobacterium sp. JAD_PAG50586_2]|nr:MAG: hypothetical protein M0D53_08920 [Flavobacterium sp. JAD_PAG50586_2]